MTNRRSLSDPCLSIHSSENAPASQRRPVGGERTGVHTYPRVGLCINVAFPYTFAGSSISGHRTISGLREVSFHFISFQVVEDSYRL
jgi:hypothetical protein